MLSALSPIRTLTEVSVPMLMSLVLTQVQRWLTYHKTIRELESLSERELSDLGIGRADIRHIARQAARSRPAAIVGVPTH